MNSLSNPCCSSCSNHSALGGNSGCSACPSGRHTAYSGAYKCVTLCADGEYEKTDLCGERCSSCELGTYLPADKGKARRSCFMCPKGRVSNVYPRPTSCIVCPVGKTSPNKSQHRAAGTGACVPLKCQAGQYFYKKCCIGKYCKQPPTCNAGCVSCQKGKTSKAGLSAATSTNADSRDCFGCKMGHLWKPGPRCFRAPCPPPACAPCAKGYYAGIYLRIPEDP